MRKYILFILLGLMMASSVLTVQTAVAQTLSATVDKNPVSLNDYLKYTLTINGGEGKLYPASMTGFDIVQGPTTNYSRSFVNGTWSTTYAETWLLKPKKTGTFTLPPGKAVIGGKTVASNAIKVQVIAGKSQNPAATQGNNSDFFVAVELSKKNVYVGEQIVATFKIYSRYGDVRFESLDYPQMGGFWTETLEKDMLEWEPRMANIKGVQYRVATLKRDVLYPQRSGTLEIGPAKVEAQGKNSFFRPYQKLSTSSRTIKVEVKPLPSGKPEHFLGTFTNLNLRVTADRQQIAANEAINLSVKVAGSGNLKLIDELPFSFPPDFEVFDPKRKDNISVNAGGMSGSRTFDYVIIPRSAGEYKVPALNLGYFDPASKKYKYISAAEMEFSISRGTGKEDAGSYTYNSKTDVSILNSDIRFIRTNPDALATASNRFFGTIGYYGLAMAPALVFFFLLFTRTRREKMEADPDTWNKKRAAKMARKHLASARKVMDTGDKKAFFGELLTALQGYLSDKFGIGLSAMDKRTIREELNGRVDAGVLDRLIDLIESTEMARFASLQEEGEEAYLKKAEEIIKGSGEVKIMLDIALGKCFKFQVSSFRPGSGILETCNLKLVALFLFILLSSLTQAQQSIEQARELFVTGNTAYESGDYEVALARYDSISRDYAGFEYHYNLGNTYYKLGRIPEAILNYERARRFNPQDEDLKVNLQMANQQTLDKIESLPTLGVKDFWSNITAESTLSTWTWLSLSAFFIAFICFIFSILISSRQRKRVLILTGILFLFGFGLCFFMGNSVIKQSKHSNEAIVFNAKVDVKSSPTEEGVDVFVLHEGTKVNIGKEQGDWYEIKIANGSVGWMKKGDLVLI